MQNIVREPFHLILHFYSVIRCVHWGVMDLEQHHAFAMAQLSQRRGADAQTLLPVELGWLTKLEKLYGSAIRERTMT